MSSLYAWPYHVWTPSCVVQMSDHSNFALWPSSGRRSSAKLCANKHLGSHGQQLLRIRFVHRRTLLRYLRSRLRQWGSLGGLILDSFRVSRFCHCLLMFAFSIKAYLLESKAAMLKLILTLVSKLITNRSTRLLLILTLNTTTNPKTNTNLKY